jgi:hypothetical protein
VKVAFAVVARELVRVRVLDRDRHVAEFQIKFELGGRDRHLLKPLRVGDNFRGVERVADGVFVAQPVLLA